MVVDLSKTPSLLSVYLTELRNKEIQLDRARFVANLERIGEIMAYELSKKLKYESGDVETPLGIATGWQCTDKLVLCAVLRAGLPLYQGFQRLFPNSESCFIAAYRQHLPGSEEFEIELNYVATPDLEQRTVILCDTMLATGASLVKAVQSLKKYGHPRAIHIVSVIASKEGLAYLIEKVPSHVNIWVGAIDDELTAHGYIVPGLGDAGDLAFGPKM